MSKRLFDLLASAIGLCVLAPVMLAIAIILKRDSPGPALFKQERVGRGGKPFILLKFRSMYVVPVDAGPLVTTANDSRITKVGAKLRNTKLDELPQLINVVRGDMSIVGPRPEVARYVSMWPEEDRTVILSVRPGITDPITLELRREEELLSAHPDPEAYYARTLLLVKARRYRDYVESRSNLRDFAIIMKTLSQVVRG